MSEVTDSDAVKPEEREWRIHQPGKIILFAASSGGALGLLALTISPQTMIWPSDLQDLALCWCFGAVLGFFCSPIPLVCLAQANLRVARPFVLWTSAVITGVVAVTQTDRLGGVVGLTWAGVAFSCMIVCIVFPRFASLRVDSASSRHLTPSFFKRLVSLPLTRPSLTLSVTALAIAAPTVTREFRRAHRARTVEAAITAAVQSDEPIDLETVISFPWDAAFLFDAYASGQIVEPSLGFEWPEFSLMVDTTNEGQFLIILVQDDTVVEWLQPGRAIREPIKERPSRFIELTKKVRGRRISREYATFRFVAKGDGYYDLVLVEKAPTESQDPPEP